MSFFREPAEEAAQRLERRREQLAREQAGATAVLPEAPPDALADGTFPTYTVWRRRDLPDGLGRGAGVPLSEGIASVMIGSVAYVPVALFTGYAPWNYVVAAVLVVALSYALWSRRVLCGRGCLAVRKFGPYRLALNAGLGPTQLAPSSGGGVLVVRTADGHRMRLRRCEFTHPEVNGPLRELVLGSGHRYGEGVRQLLDLPVREDFGHHRYLKDAFD